MAIGCFVLDDEPLATELLTSYISRLSDLHLVGVSNSPTQARLFLQQNPVDVLFLDVQMPRLTGFEVLGPLPNPPKVIMTTAFEQYALASYEFDVIDFLVKPISFARFCQAVGKLHRFQVGAAQLTLPPELAQAEPEYHYFKVEKEVIKLALADILWIESLKDYVRIHTVSQTLVSYMRISYLEAKLPPDRFIRIHKSVLISVRHIQAIGSAYVRIQDRELPVGRLYKAKLERLRERHS